MRKPFVLAWCTVKIRLLGALKFHVTKKSMVIFGDAIFVLCTSTPFRKRKIFLKLMKNYLENVVGALHNKVSFHGEEYFRVSKIITWDSPRVSFCHMFDVNFWIFHGYYIANFNMMPITHEVLFVQVITLPRVNGTYIICAVEWVFNEFYTINWLVSLWARIVRVFDTFRVFLWWDITKAQNETCLWLAIYV